MDAFNETSQTRFANETVISKLEYNVELSNTLVNYAIRTTCYLVSIPLTCMAATCACLLIRSIGIFCGRRTDPDAKKAIIITGATSGIGLALAKRVYKLGFTVFACYYNDQEPGYEELMGISNRTKCSNNATQIPIAQDQHLFLIRMNVRLQESIELAAKEIETLLDLHSLELFSLVNNAGISSDGPFELSNSETMRAIIETNLIGVVLVTKRLNLRIVNDKSRIINVSSGLYPFPGKTVALYGTTKSAIVYLSDALNSDLSSYGASCHTVVPDNFILQSNILYSCVGHLQQSLTKLTGPERETYRKTIEEYSASINRLLRLKLNSLGGDEERQHVARVFRFELPPEFTTLDDKEKSRKGKRSTLMKFCLQMSRIFVSNSVATKSFEDSAAAKGLLQTFEDMIRLQSPPRRLYAGNLLYRNILGPSVEFTPPAISRLFGPLLIESVTVGR